MFYRGDCRYEIFSTRPEHLNDGWRPTAVDVPAASSARSTLPPTPSPLIILASRAQLIRAAQGSSPNGRREAELGHAGDLGFARFFQASRVLDGEKSSMWVLCPMPAPVLAITLLAAARAHMVCLS